MSIRKKINRPVNEEYGVRNPASASCVLIITFRGRQNPRMDPYNTFRERQNLQMGSEGQKSTPFERAWTAVTVGEYIRYSSGPAWTAATAGKYIQNCRRVYPKLPASISKTVGEYI